MARKLKADGYADLVAKSKAAGMSVREAQAHARKILAARDLFTVGRDGKVRPAAAGPSIFDHSQRKRKPTHGKGGV
jgi:hypothetical protein